MTAKIQKVTYQQDLLKIPPKNLVLHDEEFVSPVKGQIRINNQNAPSWFDGVLEKSIYNLTVNDMTYIKDYIDNTAGISKIWREPVLDPIQLNTANKCILQAVTFYLTVQPVVNNTFVVTDGIVPFTFVFKVTRNSQYEVAIGATVAETMQNLNTAINTDNLVYKSVINTALTAINSNVLIVYRAAQLQPSYNDRIYGNFAVNTAKYINYNNETSYAKIIPVNLPVTDPLIKNFGFGTNTAGLIPNETHQTLSNNKQYTYDHDNGVWVLSGGTDLTAALPLLKTNNELSLNYFKGLTVLSDHLEAKVSTTGAVLKTMGAGGDELGVNVDAITLEIVENQLKIKTVGFNTYFDTAFNTKTTDDLTQGVTNLFYDTDLFDTDFAGKTTDDLTQGVTNKYYQSSLFNSDFAGKTTDDLVEGIVNLFFTNDRADDRITAQKGINNGLATLGSDGKLTTSQIPASLLGDVSYQGSWNASTNTPSLASSSGTKGFYYVVSVAGSTDLNGVTDWKLGDWAIYNGTAWEKVDNTDAVLSFNSRIGAITPQSGDYNTGLVTESGNLYFTNLRARQSISFTGTSLSYDTSTGVVEFFAASNALTGVLTNTDWNTFNNKQNLILPSSTAHYWRGDKTWQILDTDIVPETLSNLYFTNTRVRVTTLGSFTLANTAIDTGDTLIAAFGKLQGQINNINTTLSESIDDRVSVLITNGTGINWTYDDTNGTLTGNVTLTPFNTDQLTQGSANKYYATSLFNTDLATKTLNNINSPVAAYDFNGQNLTNIGDLVANYFNSIQTSSTTYYLNGVNPTSTSGEATIILHHSLVLAHQLRYTAGNLYLEAAGNGFGTNAYPNFIVGGTITTGALTVGSLTGILKASSGVVSGSATTSDLPEGTGLYYTDTRFDNRLATKNLNNIPAPGATYNFNTQKLANVYRITVGNDSFDAGALTLNGDTSIIYNDSASSSNNRVWRNYMAGGVYYHQVGNDAYNSFNSWLAVARSANTITDLDLRANNMNLHLAPNGQLILGEVNNPGVLTVPLNTEAYHYDLAFRTWRDVSYNQIGAKITAYSVNIYADNNALHQSMGLRFSTSPGESDGPYYGTLSDSSIVRMNITPYGGFEFGVQGGPQAKFDFGNQIKIVGTAHSDTFRVGSKILTGTAGELINIASFGYNSNSANSVSLSIVAERLYTDGVDWSSSAIGLLYNVDNTYNAFGGGLYFSKYAGVGGIGINQKQALARLHVTGTEFVKAVFDGDTTTDTGILINNGNTAGSTTVLFGNGSYGVSGVTTAYIEKRNASRVGNPDEFLFVNTVGATALYANNSRHIHMSGGYTRIGGHTNGTSILSVVASGDTALGNSMNSGLLSLNAGTLGSTATNVIHLASFGFRSVNESMLNIRGYRFASGSNWDTAGFYFSYDVDNTGVPDGGYFSMAGGKFGWRTLTPFSRYSFEGGAAIDAGISVRSGDVTLNLTHHSDNGGKIQVRASGTGDAIGGGYYNLRLNPEGGNVYLGGTGSAVILPDYTRINNNYYTNPATEVNPGLYLFDLSNTRYGTKLHYMADPADGVTMGFGTLLFTANQPNNWLGFGVANVTTNTDSAYTVWARFENDGAFRLSNHPKNSIYTLGVGNTAQDYSPTTSNWYAEGSTLLLNGLNYTTIGFHDAGSRIDFIRVGAGTMTLGYAGGWGSPTVHIPNRLGINTGSETLLNANDARLTVRQANTGNSNLIPGWIAATFGGGYDVSGNTVVIGGADNKAIIGGHNNSLSAWADLYINHSDGGYVGIGINHLTTLAAVLSIAGSTTGRASLNIATGVTPSAPNNGDIWNDGTNLKIMLGGVTKTII